LALFKTLSKIFSGAAPKLYLAAFGKHPGWNDHIDDLGLDTDELVAAKHFLYIQGINQNIDAAAWENLEPSQRIDGFGHDLLWHIPQTAGLIAGRLWSSVDGKGRDKYPMVLCVEIHGLPDSFAVSVAFPLLAETHARCAATSDAADVRKILDADRDHLRNLVKSAPAPDFITTADLLKVARHPDLHPGNTSNGDGFHRIIYQIVKGMAFYTIIEQSNTSKSFSRRPEQIRVPTCGMSPPDALLFWLRFCLTMIDPAVSIILLAPDPALTDVPGEKNGWIDIIVGQPTASNLFCMKAKNKTLPLTSDIPYTLEPGFIAAVDKFLDTCALLPPDSPPPRWPAL
jgi:hypothetical protein